MEPPCRQRRLEPWRHAIREQCRLEAQTHCEKGFDEERELQSQQPQFVRASSPFMTSSSSPFAQMEKEMDSFFSSVLNAPPIRTSAPPIRGRDEPEAEDPFDAIFSNMIDFSLRAFDQMMSDVAQRPAIIPSQQRISRFVVMGPVVEGKAEKSDYSDEEGVEDWGNSFEGWGDDDVNEEVKEEKEIPPEEEEDEEDPIPPPPQEDSTTTTSEDNGVVEIEIPTQTVSSAEQVAEDTLDMLVSKLAHSAAVNAMSSPLSSVNDLSGEQVFQHLFDLGNGIIEDAHARRRLSEGGAVDPHVEVKERLGRRLTEYRTDLFRYPDGTVTLYRSSSSPTTIGEFPIMSRPSPFMMSPPTSYESGSILGMGSTRVDECMKSRFDNDDLRGGCHQAVGEFLLAIDDRARPPPGAMRSSSPTTHVYLDKAEDVSPPSLLCHAIFAFIGIWALVSALTSCCNDDSDDDEEEDGGDRGEEFDYARLPEDGEEADARDEDGRVFVGVPVQVV